MPKLACPCGFVHNLSSIPDDGWKAIRDRDMEDFVKHNRAYKAGFNSPEGSAEQEASIRGGQESLKMETRLYECPECGRIMWGKVSGEAFRIYLPEESDLHLQALTLATARDFYNEQEEVRARAIKIHNQACVVIAKDINKKGLTCPHCMEFSKEMKFIDRSSYESWSFFQCPSCSRTFRLEKFGSIASGATNESK